MNHILTRLLSTGRNWISGTGRNYCRCFSLPISLSDPGARSGQCQGREGWRGQLLVLCHTTQHVLRHGTALHWVGQRSRLLFHFHSMRCDSRRQLQINRHSHYLGLKWKTENRECTIYYTLTRYEKKVYSRYILERSDTLTVDVIFRYQVLTEYSPTTCLRGVTHLLGSRGHFQDIFPLPDLIITTNLHKGQFHQHLSQKWQITINNLSYRIYSSLYVPSVLLPGDHNVFLHLTNSNHIECVHYDFQTNFIFRLLFLMVVRYIS